MAPTGLLLINVGTPQSPSPKHVRQFLREFLMDPRVIDLPWPLRALIVYAFVLPFRPRKSAEAYRLIWDPGGSPLLLHGRKLAAKVQARLGSDVMVDIAMRYGQPSIGDALRRFHAAGITRVGVFPLFPQRAASTWDSAVEKVAAEAATIWPAPDLRLVSPYYAHPAFLTAFAAVARPFVNASSPDRLLMSFHGLPVRHIRKSDPTGGRHCLQTPGCCDAIGETNRDCYRAQCFATARGIAAALDIAADVYGVGFQSRLGPSDWIGPSTSDVMARWAQVGAKRLVVLCPSFVADCLETIEEIGMRGAQEFEAFGGREFRLVPCLNSDDQWADAVVQIATEARLLGCG